MGTCPGRFNSCHPDHISCNAVETQYLETALLELSDAALREKKKLVVSTDDLDLAASPSSSVLLMGHKRSGSESWQMLLTFALYSPTMVLCATACHGRFGFGLCRGLAATNLANIISSGRQQGNQGQVCALWVHDDGRRANWTGCLDHDIVWLGILVLQSRCGTNRNRTVRGLAAGAQTTSTEPLRRCPR